MLIRIPIQFLQPGICLPGAVRDESGTQIIADGVPLTEADVARIQSLGKPYLYGGDDWPADEAQAMIEAIDNRGLVAVAEDSGDKPQPEPDRAPDGDPSRDLNPFAPSATETTISVKEFRRQLSDSLRSGMCLPYNIYDDHRVLLLAAGVQITPRFLQLLAERGIQTLTLRSTGADAVRPPRQRPAEVAGPADLQSRASLNLDKHLAGDLEKQVLLRPIRAWRRPRLSIEGLKAEAAVALERHSTTTAAVADVCDRLQDALATGQRLSDAGIGRSVGGFVEMAAHDFDLLPLVMSMQHSQDEYLFDHCVNVTMLSIALAYQLGLNHRQIMEIGLGALLQDIGMLRVPASIRLSTEPLTPAERLEIDRHPLHTVEMLEMFRGIPRIVKLIAYQVHERLDGSGYPRQRTGSQVHQYSRIVAAADCYAAMTSPRPHRPAMLPYEAARLVLTEASENKFDRDIVRAFLDTISLFPVGSYLQLDTGLRAMVLRSNPGLHTRPVIEAVDATGSPTGEIIDLSKDTSMKVVRASAKTEDTIEVGSRA